MKQKTVAIVQARMGSTRCPGKVLKTVDGKPLLWYLVERLRKSARAEEMVIATTTEEADDAIAAFCAARGVKCFRGKVDDVLDRYYQCARTFGAGIVIRITADCPMIDPRVVDSVVDEYLKEPECHLVRTGETYPEGFDTEVFPFSALETAWKEARLPSEREHVTAFLWKNEGRFRVKTLRHEEDLSKIRLTVDEDVDFEVVGKVMKALIASRGPDYSMRDVADLYKKNPSLFEANSRIVRNEGYAISLKKDGGGY